MPPDLFEAAVRVAPLGAGGSWRSELADARPLLWFNRSCGILWEALCMAFDVIGAASFAGLERLRAIVVGHVFNVPKKK